MKTHLQHKLASVGFALAVAITVCASALDLSAPAPTREAEIAALHRAADSALLWRDYYAATLNEEAYWNGQAVAYRNVAAWLEMGLLVPPAGVRSSEIIEP